MEEDLDFFFNITLENQQNKVLDEKNKTVQHNKNKVTNFLDQHILQRGKGRIFLWEKLCF